MFASYSDKTLACADCSQEFAFTASEQQFYADRQFSEPRRCPSCRASRKAARGGAGNGGYAGGGSSGGYSSGGYESGGYSSGGGGGGYQRAEREMFSATCSQCGREAQVPFRPSGAKPVYCSDCFTTQRRSY
jgi:CxxC-x17-CxxC domain-containing protein